MFLGCMCHGSKPGKTYSFVCKVNFMSQEFVLYQDWSLNGNRKCCSSRLRSMDLLRHKCRYHCTTCQALGWITDVIRTEILICELRGWKIWKLAQHWRSQSQYLSSRWWGHTLIFIAISKASVVRCTAVYTSLMHTVHCAATTPCCPEGLCTSGLKDLKDA